MNGIYSLSDVTKKGLGFWGGCWELMVWDLVKLIYIKINWEFYA
ncbi:hypothetical protein CRD_00925 [Raphidiopsis brookii D9]|nr:hypothetical protein CRD_00925 [Raphidiopsis brookii D9]